MKRKIFSKLLMVALVIAAVGSFVSCKDYDDDINNLQKQIDAKAALSELTALQSTLDSKIAAAQSAATAAQAKADAAATKTSVDELKKALETAIADAKKAGADAGTQAGTAIAAANKAQETADAAAAAAKKADEDAKAALADALKTIEETYQTKAAAAEAAEALAAVKETADAAFTKAEAEKLQEQVNNLKADLESAIDEKIDAKIKEVNNAVASVDAIWSAVTSVELVYARNNPKTQLFFYQGAQAVTYTFGKETGDLAASEYQEYKEGEDIIFRNNVIVRVNPVNADLTPDMIKLINSQGKNLDEVVKIQKVEKYDQLLTRADETGLWQITFARQEAATDADFAEATNGAAVTTTAKTQQGKALFAIAINNTKDAAAARYAVTPYNFTLWYGEYAHTNALNFNVNGNSIANLKNRWDGNLAKVVAEDETKAQSPKDYKWNNKGPAALPVIETGNDKNVAYDSRIDGDYINANVNEPIKISGIAENYIDYYYVVLDKDCAIESNPSEVRAWTSYEYEGLEKKIESGKDLNIIIKDTGKDPNGDIIGFRVFAVNYDGLLADPDGRAFYVQVGDPASIPTVVKGTATFNPTTTSRTIALAGGYGTAPYTLAGVMESGDNNVVFACDFESLGLADDISLAAANFPATVKATNASNKTAVCADVTVYVDYLKTNTLSLSGQASPATNVNEVKYVSLTVDNPEDIINDATFITNPIAVKNPDAHGSHIANVVFQIKKGTVNVAPVAYVADPFSWKSDYAPVGGVVTVYPAAQAAPGGAPWNTDYTLTPTAGVEVDLHAYANNLLTGAVNHKAVATYSAGDYTQWITDGTDNWTYTAKGTYETATTPYLGTIAPEAQYVGQLKHVVALKVTSANNGEKVSRTWKDGVAHNDASSAAQVNAAAADDYTVFNNTIRFDNILNYEEYSTNLTYQGGNVGAKASTKQNKLWLKWSAMGTSQALRAYYENATVDGSGNVTAVNEKSWKGTVYAEGAGGYINTLAGLLNVAKNTKVASFGGNAFDAGYYFFIDIAGAKVKSEDGAENEYVEIDPASTITTIGFKKVAGAPMPTRTQTMTLVVNATDCFGFKHELKVPFELSATD